MARAANQTGLAIVQLAAAAVWLYQGWWLKLIQADPRQLQVVAAPHLAVGPGSITARPDSATARPGRSP